MFYYIAAPTVKPSAPPVPQGMAIRHVKSLNTKMVLAVFF
jgi:hypothetical protein